MFGGLFLIFRKIAPKEQAAVDLGMQRLYAATEHFWPTGEFRDIANGDAGFAKELGGAASGEDFDAEGSELLGEVDDSYFVKNAYKRALNYHELPPEK